MKSDIDENKEHSHTYYKIFEGVPFRDREDVLNVLGEILKRTLPEGVISSIIFHNISQYNKSLNYNVEDNIDIKEALSYIMGVMLTFGKICSNYEEGLISKFRVKDKTLKLITYSKEDIENFSMGNSYKENPFYSGKEFKYNGIKDLLIEKEFINDNDSLNYFFGSLNKSLISDYNFSVMSISFVYKLLKEHGECSDFDSFCKEFSNITKDVKDTYKEDVLSILDSDSFLEENKGFIEKSENLFEFIKNKKDDFVKSGNWKISVNENYFRFSTEEG